MANNRNKRPGQQLVSALEDFLADVKAGKPIEQHIVRRMRVKGKMVYVHDTFKAPLRRVK